MRFVLIPGAGCTSWPWHPVTDELRSREGPMGDPCAIEQWPDVPTRAVIGVDDLLFPADFLRRMTRERLGFAPDEVPGAHFPMLSHPRVLADYLTN